MDENPLSPERAAHIQFNLANIPVFLGMPCSVCEPTSISFKVAHERFVDAWPIPDGWRCMTEAAGMFQPCEECRKPIERARIADIDPDAFREYLDSHPGAFAVEDLRSLPRKS